MQIPKKFIRPFPSYEEVFHEQIEQHKKHFLPICSINLQCVNSEWEEWLHIISVKEIHDGCVGELTSQFHSKFTKEDMIGFDVIDGKYKFEADWRFFEIEQDQSEMLQEAYLNNDIDYNIRKEYYQRKGKIYPYSSFGKTFTAVEVLEDEFTKKQESGWGLSYPPVNGILDDLRFLTEEGQKLLEDCNNENEVFEYTNLINVPKDETGQTFTYIGFATGYYFQAFGADRIYLFFNKELRKAVICFEYT
ncbi:siderophore biosynthesis protein [Paenibacillus alvei]|uniref:siderophore biosynthesis protein n=1 Tax=Niallia sp. FSL R7-0271 TaxID=2921678 RepID=UPI0030F5DD7B